MSNIEEDLKDTFYDSFSEIYGIIEETDLSSYTIKHLQDILEKDMKVCVEYILKDIKQDKKKIKELEEENKRLKEIRLEYDFGYENINLITKNDLVKIDKNRYLIEIADGKFVDIKQVYLDNLNSIPVQKVKNFLIQIQEEFNKLYKEIDKQIKDKNKDYYKCKENIAIMQTLAYCRDSLEELLEEDK